MGSPYKQYPCDLCGSTGAVEVPYARLYTNDQPIHICRKCGFVHVQQRRTSEAIAESWSLDLYGAEYTARIPAVKARQIYVLDFIDVGVGLRGKRLVDIGAGEGQFLEMARDLYGAGVFGIEPSSALCAKMRAAGLECFTGTIEQFVADHPQRKADIVTIVWTLENCCSCLDMLKGANGMLDEGGVVAVATGSRILVPFKKTLSDYLGPNPADTHCFRFSANTLRGLLAVSGFRTLKINRYRDTDYLCVIGQKTAPGEKVDWKGDHYLEVHQFFERWHHDTGFYLHCGEEE